MGRGDRETQLGAGQDGDGGGHLCRETTGRRHVGDLVTESAHDLVTVGQETQIDGHTTKDQDPGGDGGLRVEIGVVPDVEDGGEGTNGVGNIVRTVGKGGEAGRDNLDGREEALSHRVVLGSILVDSSGIGALVFMDVVSQTSKGSLLELLEEGHLALLELDQGRIDPALSIDTLSLTLLLLGLSIINNNTLALANKGNVEDVEPLERLLVLDSAAEERAEEEEAPEEDSETDTDGNTDGDTDGGRLEAGGWGTLEDDVKDLDGKGDTEVEGDGNQTALERVIVLKNNIASEHEEDGAYNTGSDGGDDPGRNNLVDTGPLDSIGTEGSDTSTRNGTDNGVGGGNGPAAGGSKENPGGGAHQGANHGQHEDFGLAGIQAGLDDSALDGLGGVGTKEVSSSELTETGNNQGLGKGNGAGTDRGGKGVGDIVGTDTIGIEESEDQTDRKEKGEVMNLHGHLGKMCVGGKEMGKEGGMYVGGGCSLT